MADIEQNLNITIKGNDVSKAAFNSAKKSMDETGDSAVALDTKTVKGFQHMNHGVETFAKNIASGNIAGAVRGLFQMIITGLHTIEAEEAIATLGITALVAAVVMVAQELKAMYDERAAAAEEAIKRNEEDIKTTKELADEVEKRHKEEVNAKDVLTKLDSEYSKAVIATITNKQNREKAAVDQELSDKLASVEKQKESIQDLQDAHLISYAERVAATEKLTDTETALETAAAREKADIDKKYEDERAKKNAEDIAKLDKIAAELARRDKEQEKMLAEAKIGIIKDATEKEIAIEDEAFREKLIKATDNEELIEALTKEHEYKITEIYRQEWDKRLDKASSFTGQIASIFNDMYSNVKEMYDRDAQNQNDILDQQQSDVKYKLEQQHASEVMGAGNNAAVKEKIDRKYALDKANLDKKQADEKVSLNNKIKADEKSHLSELFKMNQMAQIANAIVETASAAVKAFETGGGIPFGAILAALTVASGAVLVAKIASTPPPFQTAYDQMRTIPGPSNQSQVITAHGGETVGRGNGGDIHVHVQGHVFNSQDTAREIAQSLRYYTKQSSFQIQGAY